MVKVRTKDIIEKFKLELISGEEGIDRPISTSDISRPGIEMAGYFTYYPAERIQLLGKTELSFFKQLDDEQKSSNGKDVYRYHAGYHCFARNGGTERTYRSFRA